MILQLERLLNDILELKWNNKKKYWLYERNYRKMAESMKGLKRTCRCGELTKDYIGKEVTVMGWVQKSRNKGGVIFVDLRDRAGLIQLIFEEENIGSEGFEKASKLRSEFVVAVKGTVTKRAGAVNENLKNRSCSK